MNNAIDKVIHRITLTGVMLGGQARDLEHEGVPITFALAHRNKTTRKEQWLAITRGEVSASDVGDAIDSLDDKASEAHHAALKYFLEVSG